MKRLSSKRAKALDIPASVKRRVWDVCGGACVICGNMSNVMPNAHYIPRSQGGLGIEENIFVACTGFGNNCHFKFDNDAEFRKRATPIIVRHFKKHYPDWDESKLYYRKCGD